MSQLPDKRTVRKVLRRLEHMYGPRQWESWGPAVDVLVETILSQNTSRANSQAGYKQLKRRFRSWSSAADAPVEEVEQCIRISGLSALKAPRIQAILRQIRAERGSISLEFLKDMDPRTAYDYLRAFRGVGAKTASCVLLFSFRMPLFPVDTHIVRIAQRLDWVDDRTTADQTQDLLTPLIAPDDRYALHVLLIAHGRQTCKAQSPRCEWCDLLDLCPEGQRRMAE